MVAANEARKRLDKNCAAAEKRRAKAVRKSERRLDSLVRSMVPGLRDEVLNSIDASCDNTSWISVNHYEYGSKEDKAKTKAYDLVAAELEKAPYYFKIKKESSEGYNGEGNNMNDFYTYFTWTYSW